MQEDEFVSRYAEVYHLAYGPEVWPSIRRHGLLSVSALLEKWEVPEGEQRRLMHEHRARTVELRHEAHGVAYLRDQHPLNVKMLKRALVDMTVSEWLYQLNSYVFFATTRARLESLYRAYSERPRLVLTVRTSTLLDNHRDRVRLSRLNTGAVRHVDHRRGRDTLSDISEWDAKQKPAELAVAGSVEDIERHLVAVEEWRPDGGRYPFDTG